jgi:hypothetical protein
LQASDPQGADFVWPRAENELEPCYYQTLDYSQAHYNVQQPDPVFATDGSSSIAADLIPALEVHVSSPQHTENVPISVRLETLVRLDVVIKPPIPGLPLQWDYLKIPKTMSVRTSVPIILHKPLYFSLEVRGAASNETRQFICSRCYGRKGIQGLDIIDYDAKEDLIQLNHGKARISFRIRCYPHCERRIDQEYKSVLLRFLLLLNSLKHRIDAILADSNSHVLTRVPVSNLFKVGKSISRTQSGNPGSSRKNNCPVRTRRQPQRPASELIASTSTMS